MTNTAEQSQVSKEDKQSDSSNDSEGNVEEETVKEIDADGESDGDAEEKAQIAQSFADVISDSELLEALKSAGFDTPTDVQGMTLPLAINGRDVVVQAKTGSGKTLAFVLPLLVRLRRIRDNKSTQSLVITPTRELALQVQEVVAKLTNEIKPVCLIGGTSIDEQVSALKKDPRLVVGTPGRLLDLLRQKKLSLKHCEYFVLDEADETLSMGFLEDVRLILSRLPDKRQGVFVSATITPRVEMLASSFLSKPQLVFVNTPGAEHPPIEHFFCNVAGDIMAKPSALCDLIETQRPRSAIIFCNTKSDTQLVEALLRRRGFDARRLNSDLSQSQRNKVMKKIRAQDLQFLVATDIAARGIDLDQIDLVVNYSIHEETETYVHRTGRTGRAGRSGRAISLVGPRDFGAFHFINKVLDLDFKEMPLPSEEEVADARLAHLYEILRESSVEVKSRDQIVAHKFLRDLGGPEDPPEEEIALLSKLCRYTIEHNLSLDSKSLDEELEEERSEAPDPKQKGRKSREERGGRDRDRGDRDRNRDDKREQRGNRRDNDRRERPSDSDRKDSPRQENTPDEIRLYIGQGTKQGVSEAEFRRLAVEQGSIAEEDVRQLTLRENYGFVDLLEPPARALCKNLNGVEFNGEPLLVEFATVINSKRPRHQNRRGGNNRGRDSRGRGRGDNRRGGRNNRGGNSRGRSSGGGNRRGRDNRGGNRSSRDGGERGGNY